MGAQGDIHMGTIKKRKYIKKDTRKYWYKFFEEECVFCGKYSVLKERQYSEKPKNRSDRYFSTDYMCGEHY